MNKPKFKEGDLVKVIKVHEKIYADAIGAVGKIVSIDEDWLYPYEIDFDGVQYRQELFDAEQLVLVDKNGSIMNVDKIEPTSNDITMNEAIDMLLEKLYVIQDGWSPNKAFEQAIYRLTEAKMWINEGFKRGE